MSEREHETATVVVAGAQQPRGLAGVSVRISVGTIAVSPRRLRCDCKCCSAPQTGLRKYGKSLFARHSTRSPSVRPRTLTVRHGGAPHGHQTPPAPQESVSIGARPLAKRALLGSVKRQLTASRSVSFHISLVTGASTIPRELSSILCAIVVRCKDAQAGAHTTPRRFS